MALKQWISIRNIIIYLETKFCPIGGFLYFGDHFGFKMATITNQNGLHMVQHVLLPVNIHCLGAIIPNFMEKFQIN